MREQYGIAVIDKVNDIVVMTQSSFFVFDKGRLAVYNTSLYKKRVEHLSTITRSHTRIHSHSVSAFHSQLNIKRGRFDIQCVLWILIQTGRCLAIVPSYCIL